MKEQILEISDKLRNNEITEYEAQNLLLFLLDVNKAVCPKCGSHKLFYSQTGKLCCTKCIFG